MSSSVSGSSRVCSACTVARTVRVPCLSASRSPARSGVSANQHTVASSSRASTGTDAFSALLTSTSPRPTSMSSASSIETDRGATAVVRSSSRVSTAVTVELVPAGRLRTVSPTCRVPAVSRPV